MRGAGWIGQIRRDNAPMGQRESTDGTTPSGDECRVSSDDLQEEASERCPAEARMAEAQVSLAAPVSSNAQGLFRPLPPKDSAPMPRLESEDAPLFAPPLPDWHETCEKHTCSDRGRDVRMARLTAN